MDMAGVPPPSKCKAADGCLYSRRARRLCSRSLSESRPTGFDLTARGLPDRADPLRNRPSKGAKIDDLVHCHARPGRGAA